LFISYTPDYRLSLGFVEKLALLGVDEVFDADTSESEIKKRLIFGLHRVRQSEGFGGLVIVTSVKGGAGCTSIAMGMAEAIYLKGLSVCVIDFDLEYQNLSRFLMLKTISSQELADILYGHRALSFETVLTAIVDLNQEGTIGICLPPALSFEDIISRDKALQLYADILNMLSHKYDALILDLPCSCPRSIKETFMTLCDLGVLVVNPEPVSLVNFVNFCARVKSRFNYAASVGVISNRYIEGGIPERIIKAQAEESLNAVSFVDAIPFCSKARYWAGSRRTFLNLASSSLRKAMETLANKSLHCLNLQDKVVRPELESSVKPLALPSVSLDNKG
ncbi:MAG: ParA family protein, partial [Deltaproteobacteria bacterium]|nr:ParA family protein [Deltaproteobacteria bacterium]